MWFIVEAFTQLVKNVLVEFIPFLFVDAIVKAHLRYEIDEEEKKRIWFLESLVLLTIVFLIYFAHHTPYLLAILLLFTFISTQVLGVTNLVTFLQNVKVLWEENEQHKQSMDVMKEQQSRQLQALQQQQSMMLRSTPPVMNNLSPPYRGDLSLRFRPLATSSPLQPNAPLYVTNKVNNMRMNSFSSTPTGQPCVSPVGGFTQKGKYSKAPDFSNIESSFDDEKTQNKKTGYETRTNCDVSTCNSPKLSSKKNNKALFGGPLTRPSLHQVRKEREFEERATSAIKSKIMAAFGMSKFEDKPPGLRNDGQNVCFMNSVVQCLARSPGLVDKLCAETQKDMLCSMTESVLLSSATELLQYCNEGTSGGGRILDPSAFRQAGSSMNPSLISPVGHKQQQQDAAEFLMWMLSTLHNIINKNTPSIQKGKLRCPSMDALKTIYGDILDKEDLLTAVKNECRKEISASSNLDNNTCIEAIQRLSDIEWISYKKKNQSTIDDLFSGQLIEVYRSLRATKSSVKMQTFNVLPVPIVQARPDTGVVHLDDCFTKFSSVEQVAGACMFDSQTSGVKCLNSGKLRNNVRSDSGIQSTNSSHSLLSPIAAGSRDVMCNDSGFHDNVFRTTPVPTAATNHFKIRDTERCCLLRQMSDCLVVQLMRFYFDQRTGHASKICHPINIPLTDLNLSGVIYDSVTRREDMSGCSDSYRYNLYAMCIHMGAEATNCGHYISYCKQKDGRWYKFDDEVVMEINMDYEITTKEVQRNAYLLFYKKCD